MTGNVILNMSIVIPSSPHALDEDMRLMASDSSGKVAALTRNAPLTTRGGRGGRGSAPRRSPSSSAATRSPTEAKCSLSRSAQRLSVPLGAGVYLSPLGEIMNRRISRHVVL